jgi:hypothetical protein
MRYIEALDSALSSSLVLDQPLKRETTILVRAHIAVTSVTDSMSACRGARVADRTELEAAEQHIAHGSDP